MIHLMQPSHKKSDLLAIHSRTKNVGILAPPVSEQLDPLSGRPSQARNRTATISVA